MASLKVLLIEDSKEDALLLQHELRRNDYQAEIERVDTVEAFETALITKQWDIVISDYSLPNFNALNALIVFRESQIDLPFIVISGAIGDELAVAVMKAGANDFISKNNLARLSPVIERELREARIRKDRKLAELALQQSEQKYRSLFNGVPVGIYRCTPNGAIIDVNQAFGKLFCFTEVENLISKNLYDLYVYEEDYQSWRRDVEKLRVLQGFEVQMRRYDGEIIWVKESSSAEYNEAGEIIYIEGIMEDITEHRRAEETARKLLSGIENVTEMVVITDSSGLIEYVNPAFEQVTGYDKNGVLGNSPSLLKSGKQNVSYYENMWATIKMGSVWSGMLVNRRKSGELYDEEMTIAPVKNSEGEVINYVAIKRDVTERKRLLEQVLQGKKEWEATFDSVSDLIILVDVSGKIIRSNRAVALLFGVDIKAFLGVQIDKLFFGKKNRHGEFSQLHGEVTFPELEGWYEIASYPVYLEDQRHGLVYIIKDITGRKQVEASLAASQNLADIGTLAAGIAHEIKSPLQVIIGLSEARLNRLKQNEVDLNYLIQGLETINRNGWRMADIVKSLLNYARSSGREMDYYNLNELVRETLLLIGHQLQVWSNIKIENDLAADIPMFYCDRNKIEQVLINLLSNARDAMPNGGTLTIKTDYDLDKKKFILQVSDTGLGIADNLRGKIFEPFFTTKAAGQGTGLGLSIVMGIVREHDGEIKLDSAPKQGTTFTIMFPKTASVESQ